MARMARVVAAGLPHHVVQRGNRRQQTFFSSEDFILYRNLMGEWCGSLLVEVLAYCMMPNHVHLICVPADTDGLARAVGEAHRRYTLAINRRNGWKGHLWQGRFGSYVMDEPNLLACVRHIENIPVAAGFVKSPGEYPWSSAPAHIAGHDDELVTVAPLLVRVGAGWEEFLAGPDDAIDSELFSKHESTGRPLGNSNFVRELEDELGRKLLPRKRGRKPKTKAVAPVE